MTTLPGMSEQRIGPDMGRFRPLFAGIWLTACTYPVVWLVLPPLFEPLAENRWAYLWVAEIFAPAAECLLFRLAFGKARLRDLAAIVVANLLSFGLGEVIYALRR